MTLFACLEATDVLGTQTWFMGMIYQPSAYGCYLYSDRPLNDTGSQLLTYLMKNGFLMEEKQQ
jgi:hypothetical protein